MVHMCLVSSLAGRVEYAVSFSSLTSGHYDFVGRMVALSPKNVIANRFEGNPASWLTVRLW